MAKGVPIQGRNPSGKAQLANVTAEGDLKVQLSGAIVSHQLIGEYTVGPNTYRTTESMTDISAFSSFSLAIVVDGEVPHDWALAVWYLRPSNDPVPNRAIAPMETLLIVENLEWGSTKNLPVISARINPRIINNSNTERKYRLYLTGVR